MSGTRSFKQKLAAVMRLWEAKQYDRALSDVEGMRQTWPGNAELLVVWTDLVQLQENPSRSLQEVKKALQAAVELDPSSPAPGIELGHFLDAVEDDPRAASRVFAEAVASARHLLTDGLLGQARALLQLNKREEAVRCLMEALYLAGLENGSKRGRSQVHAPVASRIEELVQEAFLNRSA